jgi:hypothetical protein
VKDVLPGSFSESSGLFVPENCHRYNFTAKLDVSLPLENNTCLAEWFDNDNKIQCDSWVFAKGERTIVNDVSKSTYSIIKIKFKCLFVVAK